MKLTRTDHDTLARAESLQRQFNAGIFPRGSSQFRHFAKLTRAGLLVFEGWGRDIDREVETDVPVYRLTETAVLALQERR